MAGSNVTTKKTARRTAKRPARRLSNAELLELAGSRRPPQSWYDETGDPTKSQPKVVSMQRQELGQFVGEVLVKLDLHATAGNSGSGRSSCAEAAANEIAALTCSAV